MNGTELQRAFGTQMNQLDARLQIGTRDIFFWLNKAQIKMIQEAYVEFEKDRRLGDLIRPLQTRTEIQTTMDTFTGNDRATLPTGYLYPIAITALVGSNRDGIEFATGVDGFRTLQGQFTTARVICRIVQKDDLYRILLDPFNTTTRKEPVATFDKDFVLVYNKPDFLATKVYLEWIKEPALVSRELGCELPEHHHQALVELSVKLFMDSTGGDKALLRREPLSEPSSS